MTQIFQEKEREKDDSCPIDLKTRKIHCISIKNAIFFTVGIAMTGTGLAFGYIPGIILGVLLALYSLYSAVTEKQELKVKESKIHEIVNSQRHLQNILDVLPQKILPEVLIQISVDENTEIFAHQNDFFNILHNLAIKGKNYSYSFELEDLRRFMKQLMRAINDQNPQRIAAASRKIEGTLKSIGEKAEHHLAQLDELKKLMEK